MKFDGEESVDDQSHVVRVWSVRQLRLVELTEEKSAKIRFKLHLVHENAVRSML